MRWLLTIIVSVICLQHLFSQKTSLKIPYYPNESVDYSLKYGILKIGEAHLEFSYNKKCPGAHIIAYAKSTGLFKMINNVHFRYECCMDIATGLPISDSRILIQDEYVDINTVYYDHLTRNDASLVYSIRTDTLVVPKNIYDLLSGFYHYRMNYLRDDLPLNHSFSTTTFFIDEVWNMKIRYCGKETIDTEYGPMECLKVKPLTIIGRFFRTSDAMNIWFTNTKGNIPVKFSIDLRLGTLYGNMINYQKPH